MRLTLFFTGMFLIVAMSLAAHGDDLALKLRPLRSTCTIRVMAASAEPGGVDRRLRFLRRRLSKVPYKKYKSVKLLEEKEWHAAQGKRSELLLSEGQRLRLRFIEPITDRKRRMRFRYHLSVWRGPTPQDLGTLFSLREGGTYLREVGPLGQGALLLSLTCRIR